MNILWLTSPFKKDDILTNKDTVWVYTENMLREGGGEEIEWRRNNDNCHAIITRESIGKDGYFTEETPLATNSPYSASKASSDHIARSYYVSYDLPVLISNCSNNYGPYQHPEKLIPLTISNLLSGKEVPIYGNGRQIRDWLFV